MSHSPEATPCHSYITVANKVMAQGNLQVRKHNYNSLTVFGWAAFSNDIIRID